jgi:hypothetical protein
MRLVGKSLADSADKSLFLTMRKVFRLVKLSLILTTTIWQG